MKKSQNIMKMIAEVAAYYSRDFNREFWSNLTYLHNNVFRANFKKLFEYNKMCYPIVTMILY